MGEGKYNSKNIWDLAEKIIKAEGKYIKKRSLFGFLSKLFRRSKNDYEQSYFAICLPKNHDYFDDLKILDFSPRAITGDITSLVRPSPEKEIIFFAKVVGFSDIHEEKNSWGMDYKKYIKEKRKYNG